MKIRNAAAAAVLLLTMGAGSAWAQLSDQYEKWADGPVKFLMTKDDERAWDKIRTDAEAEKFIDLFWARRDPSPATPENELRQAFDQRVQLADQRFTAGRTPGSLTDRGKVLILIGPPTKIVRNQAAPTSGIQTPTQGVAPVESTSNTNIPTETWIWETAEVPQFLREKYKEMEISFVDQNFMNDWKIGRSPKTDANAAMRQAVTFYQFQPNLTEVPQYAQAAPAAPVAAPEPQVSTSFQTPQLETAWKEFRAAEKSPYDHVHVNYGAFVTTEGEYFVPVQVYMRANEALPAGTEAKFFAVIEKADGTIAAVYEEPVTVSASKADVYVDRSLSLDPGTYTGTFGVAVDDKPVSMATTKLELAAIDKDAAGISDLILSNNIYALTEAQLPTDPFAFGGIKVVPKGDATFTQADELWYFFEMRNPALNEEGKPKVQVGIDVTGEVDGKKKRFRLPLTEVDPQELKGVPGHYAVGSAIPLSGFAPGTYTMEMKVIDTVAKNTYNLKRTFTVVAQ